VRAQAAESQSAAAARIAEVTHLQGVLASVVARAAEVATELAVVKDQGAAEIARLSAGLTAASRRATQLESAVSALKTELDAIKQSSAWRLTRPLRLIGARLPWIRRRIRQVLKLIHWSATLRLFSEVRHRLRLRRGYRLIIASGLFDDDWYLDQYPDVRSAGTNPLVHYLRHGAAEGRDPNPLFDSDWYLRHNRDVRAAGINPLVHYLQNGAAEGRNPSPHFDNVQYLAQNPDAAAAGVNPLAHCLMRNRRRPQSMRPG